MRVSNPFQAFLYLILRDQLPAGIIESAAREAEKAAAKGGIEFSNAPLAAYAAEVTQRLSAVPAAPSGAMLVACQCDAGDPCPQGRVGAEARCQILVKRSP